jgi:hypothetical protein
MQSDQGMGVVDHLHLPGLATLDVYAQLLVQLARQGLFGGLARLSERFVRVSLVILTSADLTPNPLGRI